MKKEIAIKLLCKILIKSPSHDFSHDAEHFIYSQRKKKIPHLLNTLIRTWIFIKDYSTMLRNSLKHGLKLKVTKNNYSET